MPKISKYHHYLHKRVKLKKKTKKKQNKTKQKKRMVGKNTSCNEGQKRHFHFRGYFGVCYSIFTTSHKNYPLSPTNVGFPIAQTMGFAAVQH